MKYNQNVQDEDCKGLEFMDVSTVQYWCPEQFTNSPLQLEIYFNSIL